MLIIDGCVLNIVLFLKIPDKIDEYNRKQEWQHPYVAKHKKFKEGQTDKMNDSEDVQLINNS